MTTIRKEIRDIFIFDEGENCVETFEVSREPIPFSGGSETGIVNGISFRSTWQREVSIEEEGMVTKFEIAVMQSMSRGHNTHVSKFTRHIPKGWTVREETGMCQMPVDWDCF